MPGHNRTDPDYVFGRKPDLIQIPKKGTPNLILPVMRDLWNDVRLEKNYYWDDKIKGYRRKLNPNLTTPVNDKT